MTAIKKDDWKTENMPNETIEFDINKRISDNEYASLILGFKPKQMEDKWFAYVENNKLYFHRSWTGFCIYETEIEKAKNGYLLSKTLTNRKTEQYRETDIEKDKEMINFLIDRILLGKKVSFPNLKPIKIKEKKKSSTKNRFKNFFGIYRK